MGRAPCHQLHQHGEQQQLHGRKMLREHRGADAGHHIHTVVEHHRGHNIQRDALRQVQPQQLAEGPYPHRQQECTDGEGGLLLLIGHAFFGKEACQHDGHREGRAKAQHDNQVEGVQRQLARRQPAEQHGGQQRAQRGGQQENTSRSMLTRLRSTKSPVISVLMEL